MGYRKSIRGNNNEASEQLSHNRITIEMGSSGVILVVFVCLLVSASIGWVIVETGMLLLDLLVVSLFACFAGAGVIGLCYVVRHISDAHTHVQNNKILSNTIVAGDVVAYRDREEWDHLSAEYEMAKIPRVLPPPKDEVPWEANEKDIIQMYNDGQMTLQAIVDFSKMKYWKVQRIISEAKKRGLITRD
jgi:hypothetical protein